MAHPLIEIENNSVDSVKYFNFNSIVLTEALRCAGIKIMFSFRRTCSLESQQ